MPLVNTPRVEGETIEAGLFGGNFLADRYHANRDDNAKEVIDRLGVEGLRYPGGSLTERLFDIGNPDAARVTNDDGSERDFVPLSEFMNYARDSDHPATIVIPTRDALSRQSDQNGDRFPAFDEAELRGFVRDVATGKYGDAEVAAFEIGNEYWGSGQMTAVEYGRLSSRMAEIIDDELTLVAGQTGEDPGIDVIVQAGTNFAFSNLSNDYAGQPPDEVLEDLNDRFGADMGRDVTFANGRINWRAVSDHLILREYSAAEAEAVDGVVTHLYSKDSVSPGQRDFGLKQIERSWEEEFPGIDIHVTEWNVSASDPRLSEDSDFGLYQAKEVLDVFETMVESGVDQAHIWPLLQNTKNALSPDDADGGFSPAGQMFAMMSDALPGKTMLDFTRTGDRQTEFQGRFAELHGFYGDNELVFYLASTSDKTETLSFDLSRIVDEGGRAKASILGVAGQQGPGSIESRPEVENVPAEEIYDNNTIVTALDPGEILELRLTDFRPTQEFAPVMRQIDQGGVAPSPTAPTAPPQDQQDDDAEAPDPLPGFAQEDSPLPFTAPPSVEEIEEQDRDAEAQAAEDEDTGFLDVLGWLLGLLPLLALAGIGG
ncbi:hypothetical protein [Jannaschia sp. M317]|uniref:hypothetical protein n=1 Tax=Jannaschia sp. M317 TaxID=2867011 RepID=UPI0021A2EABD|nr:hypothetical protein [Jannaschia sp. M317]UWQ16233.1 hypothetical protein K3551_09840 [Jannaschia sp. M317]